MIKILFVVLFILFSCKKENTKQIIIDSKEEVKVYQKDDEDELKLNLINTVLNHPLVVDYSKIELIQSKFNTIYIINNLGLQENSLVLIKDIKLTLLNEKTKIDLEVNPCYFFESFEIKNDKAYVLMFFDVTGVFVEGNFILNNNVWIPSDNFRVGVR